MGKRRGNNKPQFREDDRALLKGSAVRILKLYTTTFKYPGKRSQVSYAYDVETVEGDTLLVRERDLTVQD